MTATTLARCCSGILAAATALVANDAYAAPSFSPHQAHCVLVTSRDTGELVLVQPQTLAVARRIAVGNGPHEVVATTAGIAYISNYGQQAPGNSISVVDIARGIEVDRIDLGALRRPHGLALAGSALFVTAEVNRVVARIDTATHAVDEILGIGADASHMLDVRPDGGRIYTTNILSGSVTELTPSAPGALPPQRHLPTPGNPEGLALSPDGATLWVGRNQAGRISIIDTATWTVVDDIASGQVPFRLRFSPDGTRVAVADPAGNAMRLYDAKRRSLLHTVPLPAPGGVAFSPDGGVLYAPLLAAQAVAQVDVRTGSVLRQAPTGPVSDGVAVAPRACTQRSDA